MCNSASIPEMLERLKLLRKLLMTKTTVGDIFSHGLGGYIACSIFSNSSDSLFCPKRWSNHRRVVLLTLHIGGVGFAEINGD